MKRDQSGKGFGEEHRFVALKLANDPARVLVERKRLVVRV
jgi:hypothetical protein